MMQIAGFEFADGARFQPGAHTADPNAIGQHIEFLRLQCKGELQARDVIDDARNPNSPLHSFFEWDEGAAAEQYRLQQARGLIRSVVAIYTQPGKPATRTKAYVHIPEKGAPHYREASHAMSQANTRQMVLQRAWREFQQWRQRYRDLTEFAALITVADEIEKKLPRSVRES